MLEGEKVILRPVKRSDRDSLVKWVNDPEVTQYLSMYLPMTEMQEEQYIESLGVAGPVTDIMLIIDAREGENRVSIGTVGLHKIDWKDRRAVFGISIGEKSYWNRGCGTETAELMVKYAFEQLNLRRISSMVFDFNSRSLKMHLNLGFIEEGRKRESCFRNGGWHDTVVFGLLRREWRAKS